VLKDSDILKYKYEHNLEKTQPVNDTEKTKVNTRER
jgi:hypothetical protein